MTPEQVSTLGFGDIVRHVPTGRAYVVLQNTIRAVHAIRHCSVSNPIEWDTKVPLENVSVGSVVRHFSGFDVVLVAPGLGVMARLITDDPQDWVLFAKSRHVGENPDVFPDVP